MTIIRQPSLFSIQEIYDMEPTQKYDAIISAINMDAIYYEISKKSRIGAPTKLNYPTMIISVFIRYVERIPTIKDLIKRLKDDIAFKRNYGFLVSDHVPSEASYSSLLDKLSNLNILKECSECPLANEGICQKVFKMKITKDLRRYTAPARGSQVWQKIYNRRTAVERVIAYLKEFFQLNNVRYRSCKRAKVHIDIVTLIYNASKLTVDRINTALMQQLRVS